MAKLDEHHGIVWRAIGAGLITALIIIVLGLIVVTGLVTWSACSTITAETLSVVVIAAGALAVGWRSARGAADRLLMHAIIAGVVFALLLIGITMAIYGTAVFAAIIWWKLVIYLLMPVLGGILALAIRPRRHHRRH